MYLYSPVVKLHADESDSAVVVTRIKPVVSLNLDTSNLNFNFSSTLSEGAFSSSPIAATVATNSRTGYELYFSSVDDTADMVHSDPTVNDTISSDFSGVVTSSTMPSDAWGYSLNNTDFLKIPILSEQAKIRNLDHSPSVAEKTTQVYIGVKASSNLTAGTYNKDIKFTAFAHEMPNLNKLTELTSMQDSNLQTYCAETYTPTSAATISTTSTNFFGDYVPTATLIDLRDNNTYKVKKLADGRCWMTENLRIANKTITPEDSNVTENFTIPASALQTGSKVYVDDSAYGGYYGYEVVFAGTEDKRQTFGFDSSVKYAPSSICPKGWKIPTMKYGYSVAGKAQFEWNKMFDITYQRVRSTIEDVFEPALGGVLSNGKDFSSLLLGKTGQYWASVITTQNSSGTTIDDYTNSVTFHSVDSVYNSKPEEIGGYSQSLIKNNNAYSVRCIAK